MTDEERFEAGQVLYLERLLNGKWFRKGHVRLEDYIAERLEESRQYREQWLRAVEQERQKVRAEFEEWKKNHLNHEADDLRAEVEQLRRDWAETQNALNQAAYERDEARALLESTKERALSAEREVDAMLRVLNGYRSFPLPSVAMHAKQVLEQLEARIDRLTLEVVQHESQLEEARASTESLTAEFQRAVADCDDARAALSALDADGFAKFAAETARASQLEAEVARLRAELKRSQDYGAGPTWSTHREALVAVAEKQREASLRRVFFKLKAALGAGAHQKALEEVIDAERAAPLVTEGKP